MYRIKLDSLFQDGGVQKSSSTKFSLVSSINIAFCTENFPTFNFSSIVTLLQNFKAITKCQSQIIKLKLRSSLKKKWFFWSKLYKIEVMTTFSYNCWSYKALVTCPHLQYSLCHSIKFWWRRHEQKLWHHQHQLKLSKL